MDSILCLTYLAKSLGPFDEWEGRLQTAKEIGYNMIHITPVQELGGSRSSYSLRNQLKLNPMFDYKGKKCSLSDISNLVEKMRTEWKVCLLYFFNYIFYVCILSFKYSCEFFCKNQITEELLF